MKDRRKIIIWIVALVGLSLVLLMAPSPREWGGLGRSLSRYYNQVRHVLQPAVHFSLMSAIAFALMLLFVHQPLGEAAFHAVAITVCLAILLELLQSLLPAQFARECDPYDLIPSTAGALAGTIFGWFQRVRSSNL